MSNGNGREHTMKRLVVVILVVLAAMAVAPSVASARSAPGVFVRPMKSSPMPAKPMYWKAMWLTAQHPSPVGFFAPMWLTAQHPAPVGLVAPMPALERYKAMRLSPQKLAILKISSKAR
jgi:hypothetical protein